MKKLVLCFSFCFSVALVFSQPNLNFHTFADDFVPTDTVWVDVNFNYSLVSPGEAPHAFYDTIYVGTGSVEYPFISLVQALSSYPHAAKAGHLVNVKAGVYPNYGPLYNFSEHHGYYDYQVTENTALVVRESGTRQTPIKIFSSDGPGKAIIDGENQGVGVYMDGREYIIIEGFEVRNCGQNIQAKGSEEMGEERVGSNLVIRNCHVHHANENGDCIKISQMDSVYIQNCKLHDPGWRTGNAAGHRQESLDFVAVNQGHVIFCEVYNGEVGLYAKGGSRDIVFYGNYIHDHIGSGLTLGGWTSEAYFYNANNDSLDDRYEGYRIYAINNVIANTTGPGLEFIGCTDCVAEHNTLWNIARGEDWDSPVMFRPGEIATYWYNQGETASNNLNATFRNNIVANEHGEFQHFIRNNDQGSGIRASQDEIHFYNNLWWCDGLTLTDGNEINHLTGSGEANSLYGQTPSLQTPPPSLMPSDTSSVIDGAYAVSYIQKDYNGNTRDGLPDIGAFEYKPNHDCNGDENGDAFVDSCGYCVGGNTGKEACEATGISQSEDNLLLKTYPNPVIDILTIQSQERIRVVYFLDVTGIIVRQENINQSEAKMNISGLEKGIYILQIIGINGKICTRKIIKQ
jgi:hypothetical protein